MKGDDLIQEIDAVANSLGTSVALNVAKKAIMKLAEQLHYANGTCELAMKHRDEAEAAIAQAKGEKP